MNHISEVLSSILPFRLDNVRELSLEDRDRLRQELNEWLKAGNISPAVLSATKDALNGRGRNINTTSGEESGR